MRFLILVVGLLSLTVAHAKVVRDTVWTTSNDKIILTYDLSLSDNHLSIDFSRPRIIPSKALNKICKGEIDRLKVVVFDRIGNFGRTQWSGISPKAFMIPDGFSYSRTSEGYYILGESQPLEFKKKGQNNVILRLPMFIAVYDKKQQYRIVALSKGPFNISYAPAETKRTIQKSSVKTRTETERIAVTSSEEIEADNADITSALSSIEMVKELLARETEIPFSQTLQMEIYNLRFMKNKIREPEIIDKINKVLMQCDDKERELKEAQSQSALAAKAEEQALMQQQKQEAEAQQKEAEEKAKAQEEKQQKRTIWMIIGGVILGILGFVGNALFKHFRDISNQKSIMQMQESLVRQAEHEAGRRSREIIRNKAHTMANKGRNKLRNSLNNSGKQPKNNKTRSI